MRRADAVRHICVQSEINPPDKTKVRGCQCQQRQPNDGPGLGPQMNKLVADLVEKCGGARQPVARPACSQLNPHSRVPAAAELRARPRGGGAGTRTWASCRSWS